MKKDLEYVIYCRSFDENSGGLVALYKLCDILNSLGHKAYMCPYIKYLKIYGDESLSLKGFLRHPINYLIIVLEIIVRYAKYKSQPNWKNPLVNFFDFVFNLNSSNKVAVYPEIIQGNPLRYNKVVRWLMHNPGHFTNKVEYGENELYFLYSKSFGHDFPIKKGSVISEKIISVGTSPECFNNDANVKKRDLISYCIRKGKGKKLIHDVDNSVLVDDLSLKETAEVLKRSKMFISYDPVTALSRFALLCHCPSYIILGENETPYTYRSNDDIVKRFAYRLDEKDFDWEESYKWAEQRRDQKETESVEAVKVFVDEVNRFFS